MPRQERYSYSPQTQAQLIDYSPVDYSAGDALALQYLGERNKAYNEAEAMPTAFSSAIGDMMFSNNDRATIDKHMQRINDDINKEVNEKYNGDYALAKSAIAKKLMSSKNIFNIAQQNYELEAKARDRVNELIAMGKGPTEFVDDGKGNIVRRNITPDELFAGKSVFDSQGNIKGLPNYEIYSAGEHSKWVEDAYSKALNAATSPETISKDPKAVGYLRVAKARGMSDEDVQNYMFGKDGNLNPTGQSIVDTFLKDSPQAAREFAKIKDHNLIGKYVANIIKGQTSMVSDSQFLSDKAWDFEESMRKSAAKNKPDPGLDTFTTSMTAATEDNPFVTREERSTNIFDKPFIGTGDYSNMEDIFNEYNRLSKETKGRRAGEPVSYKDAQFLKVREAKEKAEKFKPILDDYKKEKSPKLKSAGIAIPKTDREWAKMYDSDKEYAYVSTDEDFMISPMAQKGIKMVMKNNASIPMQKAFRLSGNYGLGPVPLKEISDETGINEEALLYQIQNNDVNFNTNTGEFYTSVSEGEITGNGFKPSGGRKKVYFTLDDVTSRYSSSLKTLKKLTSDNSKTKTPLVDDSLVKALYNSNGTITMMVKDPGSNSTTTYENLSPAQYRLAMKSLIGGHIQKNYTIPSLSYSQQAKQED